MSKYTFPKDRVFITPSLLRVRYGGDFNPNLFKKWQDEGKVVKIRNGLYLQPDFTLRGDLDRFLIANRLYEPSYISLHSALRYYNIIPESVYEVTSLGPRKTNQFVFKNTTYSYQQVKEPLFFGFQSVDWRGESFRIATPEKALLDYAYLEPQFDNPSWLAEMRFDVMEMDDLISWDKMFEYADIMDSTVVKNRITKLLDVYYP